MILLSLVLLSLSWHQIPMPGPGTMGSHASGGTPSLTQFFGKNVITRSTTTGMNAPIFTLDPTAWPNGVTTGSLVIVSGEWPNNPTTGNGYVQTCASPCTPTLTDNGNSGSGNTWNSTFTVGSGCKDAGIAIPNGADHNIYYAMNFVPPATTTPTQVTVTWGHKTGDFYFGLGSFYNIATTGALRTSSCKTAVVPTNNTAPNISGTGITVVVGDLVYIEVDDESENNTMQQGNAWGAITIPSGCTLLDENTFAGHLEMYCIATATSFTPAVTISQTTHDSFTIMAAAFKPGSGGSAPTGSGAQVLASSQNMSNVAATYVQNIPCPTNTTMVVVTDDASYVTSVSDSLSNNFSSVSNGGGSGTVWYHSVTISNPNTYTISAVSAGGGNDLLTYYCTTATSLDTAATAGSGSTQITSSSVFKDTTAGSTPSTGASISGVPLITPGETNDLLIGTGTMGTGPVLSVSGPTGVVDDFPCPTAINACSVTTAGVCGGDSSGLTNGDVGLHFFDTAQTQLSFNFVVNPSQSLGMLITAFH